MLRSAWPIYHQCMYPACAHVCVLRAFFLLFPIYYIYWRWSLRISTRTHLRLHFRNLPPSLTESSISHDLLSSSVKSRNHPPEILYHIKKKATKTDFFQQILECRCGSNVSLGEFESILICRDRTSRLSAKDNQSAEHWFNRDDESPGSSFTRSPSRRPVRDATNH